MTQTRHADAYFTISAKPSEFFHSVLLSRIGHRSDSSPRLRLRLRVASSLELESQNNFRGDSRSSAIAFFPRRFASPILAAFCVRPTVCLSGVVSNLLYGSSWFLAQRLPSTYLTLRCKGNSGISKNMGTSMSRTLDWKQFRHGTSTVAKCCEPSTDDRRLLITRSVRICIQCQGYVDVYVCRLQLGLVDK